jgi:hypothetical protein
MALGAIAMPSVVEKLQEIGTYIVRHAALGGRTVIGPPYTLKTDDVVKYGRQDDEAKALFAEQAPKLLEATHRMKSDGKSVHFHPPALIGPSTSACHDCGPPWPSKEAKNGTGEPAVCAGQLVNGSAPPASTAPQQLNACMMCCAWYFSLTESFYVGYGAGTSSNGGHFADGSGFYPDQIPLYVSSNAGASWALSGRASAAAVSAMGAPAQLIPGPGAGELHSTGILEVVGEWSTTAVIASNSSTIFSVGADGHTLAQRAGPSVSYHGVPLSDKCPFSAGDLGHVGPWGLRLTGAGVTTLTDGSVFATAVACLGGAAQTAKQRTTMASSLIGLRSVDGYRFDYVAPILTASLMPESVTGATENDVELLADNRTLIVVARTDGDGSCAVPMPVGSRYWDYTTVTSTDGAHHRLCGSVAVRILNTGSASAVHRRQDLECTEADPRSGLCEAEAPAAAWRRPAVAIRWQVLLGQHHRHLCVGQASRQRCVRAHFTELRAQSTVGWRRFLRLRRQVRQWQRLLWKDDADVGVYAI